MGYAVRLITKVLHVRDVRQEGQLFSAKIEAQVRLEPCHMIAGTNASTAVATEAARRIKTDVHCLVDCIKIYNFFSRCVEAESHSPVKLWDFDTTPDDSWGSSGCTVKMISPGYSNSYSAQVTARYGTV